MHMWHRLASTRTVIDSDVVCGRRKLLVQPGFGSIKHTHHGIAFIGAQIEKRANVAFRQNQRVPS